MTMWRFLLMGLLAASGVAAGQVVEIPGAGLEFKQPGTWTKVAMPGMLYAAQDALGQSNLIVAEHPNPTNLPVDDASFLKGLKDGIANKAKSDGTALTIAQEGPLTIQGVPFYEVKGAFSPASAPPEYFHSYVTAANGKFYLFSFRSTTAASDVVWQGMANSVTFKNPPVLPHRRTLTADRWAKTIGEAVGILLVVYLFYWYRTRRSGRKG
jgi:hypothetical protein